MPLSLYTAHNYVGMPFVCQSANVLSVVQLIELAYGSWRIGFGVLAKPCDRSEIILQFININHWRTQARINGNLMYFESCSGHISGLTEMTKLN